MTDLQSSCEFCGLAIKDHDTKHFPAILADPAAKARKIANSWFINSQSNKESVIRDIVAALEAERKAGYDEGKHVGKLEGFAEAKRIVEHDL